MPMSGKAWNPGKAGGIWQNYYKNTPASKTAMYDAKKIGRASCRERV